MVGYKGRPSKRKIEKYQQTRLISILITLAHYKPLFEFFLHPSDPTMPDNFDLTGKVAIVTGSGRERGIGAGIARALARNGAAVTINYVSPSTTVSAENVAKDIRAAGGRVAVVRADVSTVAGAEKIVQETTKAFGDKIDILSKCV